MNPVPPTDEFIQVHHDAWFHLQQRFGLVPKDGKEGLIRRTVFFCLLAWLPIVIWALVSGRVFHSTTGEPLLQHYSIHARFLLALPALILGECFARTSMKRILPRFIQMGVIPDEKVPAFYEVIVRLIALRNSTLPWVAIVCVIFSASLFPETGTHLEELNWAVDHGGLGFGGWWFLLVARPIYQLFLFAWLWRVVLLFVLFRRIIKLGINLMPAHPDRLGGIAFIAATPRGFAPLAFAVSCVTASKWAHDIAWHGANVEGLKIYGALFIGAILIVCLSPLTVFLPILRRVKRRGLAEYGQLVARHDRLVEQVWLRGEPAQDRSLLEAPELGPSCDIHSLYDSVRNMRILPVDKSSLLPLLIPLLVPLLVASAIEIPIGDLIGKVFKMVL